MSLTMTAHSLDRAKGRSISPAVIEWLLRFGREEHIGCGFRRFAFDRRTWRRFQAWLGDIDLPSAAKARNAYAVVAADEAVITVGYRHRRLKR